MRRLLYCIALIPFLFAGWLLQYAFTQVLITEIMYDPVQKKDTGHEWVEIVNVGDEAVAIKDIRFQEGGSNHRIRPVDEKEDLQPNEVAVLVQDPAEFLEEYEEYDATVFVSIFSLRQKNQIGETIGIFNTKTKSLDSEVTYTPSPKSSGTGATVHIGENRVHSIAPATPGSIATNPIIAVAEESEVVIKDEEKEKEIVVESSISPTKKVSTAAITKPKSQSVQPEEITTAPDYTAFFKKMVIMGFIIIFEIAILIVLLSMLVLHFKKHAKYSKVDRN